MTNFTSPSNVSSMKYTLKSVPGLADVGAPHGDGDGPRTAARCIFGSLKKFKLLILLFLTELGRKRFRKAVTSLVV